MEVIVNYWAVLASAIVSMVIGTLWYGPIFGKSWMSLVGLDSSKKPKSMTGIMMLALVSSFITALVISHVATFSGYFLDISGLSLGLKTGFWMWLGFAAPITLGVVLWEMKPWKLWFINSSYYLISFLIQGIILATWL